MFVSPSKIKQNKILRNRTLSFETANKTHGNLILVPTSDRDAFTQTISGSLFRPMQLLAVYAPRKVKPEGRQAVILNQKDYYKEMRVSTNGRMKKGKTILSAYGGQNLVYDIYNSYTINRDAFVKRRYVRQRLQKSCWEYLENLIYNCSNEPEYSHTYLIFPLVKPFENPQQVFVNGTDFLTTDPTALFMQAVKKGTLDKSKLSNVKLVIFYVPKGDIMLAFDINDPELDKKWPSIVQKLKRLNNFCAGTDDLSDVLESEDDDSDLDDEDKYENKKEQIKQVVLKKVAKTVHAKNLDDFEAATRDERDLMVSIDKKVDDYLSKPENLKKTMSDLVEDIEKDPEVTTKAIRYVETKKADIMRADTLSKNLEKETEIVGSLQDLDDDSEENEGATYKVNLSNIDSRIERSHLGSFDEEYNKKQAMKDLSNVVSSFSNKEYTPMTLDSLTYEDTSTDQDEKRTLHLRYKTDDNKTLSLQIDVPKIVDKRYLYLGGNKKVIKKQMVRLPIVKTKEDRVEITTNYNKMTIERTSGTLSRKNAYFLKKIKEITNSPGVEIDYGDNRIVNGKLGYSNDFEYEELAGSLNKIKTLKYEIIFNRDIMGDELSVLDIPDDFVTSTMTPFGLKKSGEDIEGVIFIEDGKIFLYTIKEKRTEKVNDSLFQFLSNDVLNLDMSTLPAIGKVYMYTKVKFLRTTLPLFIMVASQVGITNILNRYKVNYHKSIKKEPKNINYIEVKFKDCYLYYEDTIRNTLLLNALYLMNTSEYNYSDFDIDEPYTSYFMDALGPSVGIHTRNTLKINLSVLIDPITLDILRDLKLPTNAIDLILYANTLLVGNQYRPLNDMTNYRFRSNELVADVLYQILADAYVEYAKHKLNGRPINLTVPKGLLVSKLLQQQNINDKSTLNPVIEAEQIAQASAKGFHGVNINSAYTLEMRAYDDTMTGIISGNATPYSGQAGITRSLSYDPEINSIRGYVPREKGEMSAVNLLSPTELLSPFTSVSADPPRQAMQVAQTGHTLPVRKTNKQLVGSGMNKTLAFLISDDFCFKSKKPGIVEKIDQKNKVVILLYDDGTKDAIDLDDKLDKNSGMGFYIHQTFKLVYSEGERFNEGDVLAYNPSYFTGKGKDVDYCPGTLAKVAVAPGDFAFEDSTLITDSLADKCTSKINMLKPVVLGKNAAIHKLVRVGDLVNTDESLIEFTTSFDDPDTAEMLAKLRASLSDEELDEITHETVKSKYTGKITRVEMFYNCPFEELSPSLQDIIREYKNTKESRAKSVEGINTGSVHVPILRQTNAKKMR